MDKKTYIGTCIGVILITSILIRLEIAETWMALIWSGALFLGMVKLLKK
jgi:hypothetical protein